jgi:PDZ domain
MSLGLFGPPAVRRFYLSPAIFLILLNVLVPRPAAADERGMIGLVLRQVYDDRRPDHRGPLAVIVEDSPADQAGIHCSDFIVAINGVPVPGREFSEILTKDLQGPVGGTVRLSVSRYDGSQSEITLVRAPFRTHTNLRSDPFVYTVPGSWSADPRYTFPLPWAPRLAYHGFEDVYFAPEFDNTESPEYHSILFFMWLEGTHRLSAAQLESTIKEYFRGLADERGRNYGFTPDLSKVSVTYQEDSGTAHRFGGSPARGFNGSVTLWDMHGKLITLNSEVEISDCGTASNTVLFYGMSRQPPDGEIWKQIDAVRDGFRCRR